MRAKNQRKQTESLLKRIRKRCEWVGRCEICERLSERGEKRTTAPSVSDPGPAKRPPSSAALPASWPSPPSLPRPPRSHQPIWSTRALSTTVATRDAPTPEPKPSTAPAPIPAPAPNPKPEPTPKPDLKALVLRAARAPRDPVLFAPLRRPRFPIVLCHGAPGCAARAACVELTAQGLCRDVRAGRVPEHAGSLFPERAQSPAQYRWRGGARHLRFVVRVPSASTFPALNVVPTAKRSSSNARKSSTAPPPRVYTAET
jgi:hypothetical protein